MSLADTPLFSPYWYKLGGLRPRLRPGVTVSRRVEQGAVWHILSAPESNRHFRLDQAAYAIIGALDGRQTLDAIWRRALDRFGDSAPGQDETIRLLGQLHQADALNAGTAPTLGEFERRARRMQRQKALQQLRNPMFFRIPLVDPDRWLTATLPVVRPVFSRAGFVVWLTIMVWLAAQAVRNWDALAATVADRALAFDNLMIAALVFPVAKAVHEFAHGWAVKFWGGEVREVGIMFLVFLPAPYVDASAAAAFPRKRQRIVTSAAGMMAEAVLAAIAMAVWMQAETGFVSALAFNMILIAGVSTFLFNGNPLLRFDAYFMLCDAIGVQNLGGRSQKWWGWLVYRFGFGIARTENPARTRAEAVWFALYHPASYAYRVFLTLSIALFVASEYRAVGLALAVWAVTTTFVIPFATALWSVATAPRVAPRRGRALAVTAALIAAPVALLLFVPLPHGTVAPGVVAEPDGTRVVAPVEAEIAALDRLAGDSVETGARLAVLTAPLLASRLDVATARLRATRARLLAEEAAPEGAGQAAALRAEIGYLSTEVSQLADDLAQLALAAPASGQVLAKADRLIPGRRFPRGAEIGVIAPPLAHASLRVAVPATRIEEVRRAVRGVEVRHPGRLFDPVSGVLVRLAPEATRRIDYSALTAPAGGPLTLDPGDAQGTRVVAPVHIAEIETALPLSATAVGALVWVRFDHGPSPLAPRLWRLARQTFLTRLAL